MATRPRPRRHTPADGRRWAAEPPPRRHRHRHAHARCVRIDGTGAPRRRRSGVRDEGIGAGAGRRPCGGRGGAPTGRLRRHRRRGGKTARREHEAVHLDAARGGAAGAIRGRHRRGQHDFGAAGGAQDGDRCAENDGLPGRGTLRALRHGVARTRRRRRRRGRGGGLCAGGGADARVEPFATAADVGFCRSRRADPRCGHGRGDGTAVFDSAHRPCHVGASHGAPARSAAAAIRRAARESARADGDARGVLLDAVRVRDGQPGGRGRGDGRRGGRLRRLRRDPRWACCSCSRACRCPACRWPASLGAT